MKPVTMIALAATTALMTMAIADPADAQRRRGQQQEAAPADANGFTPTLGREFRQAAAAADTAATAQDWATANTALQTAAPLATTPDERFVLGQIRLKVGLGTNDKAIQRTALQEMVASGSGPAAERPRYQYFLGTLAYEAGDNAAAIQNLAAARDAGYQDENLGLLIAEAHFRSNQPREGLAAVERAIEMERAAGRTPPENWFARARSVAYQSREALPGEVAKWSRLQVQAYPTPENWRAALVIFEENQDLDDQQTLDLYRLKRAAGALASERDYFTYANAAFTRGLPGEAKTVIDEGHAAGKFQRTASPFSDIYTRANAAIPGDRREVAQSEARVASGNGPLALDTANVYLAYGEDAKASQLFRTAIEKGGVDANSANLRLGIALARQGQYADAVTAFDRVSGDGRDIAQFWKLWSQLRAGGGPAATTPATS